MKAALIARSTSALSKPIAINCWIAPSLAEPTLNAFGSPKAAGPAGTAAGCGAGGGDVAVVVAGVAGGGTGIAPGCGAGAELDTVGVDTVGAGVDGFAGEAVLVGLGFKSDKDQSGVKVPSLPCILRNPSLGFCMTPRFGRQLGFCLLRSELISYG